jgi:hypothetical protein
VNAFWFVTMYDGKMQLLIENPISRYLINSPFAHAVHLTDVDGPGCPMVYSKTVIS